MISVRNLRPLLSGNRYVLFLVVALLTGACSPKTVPTGKPSTKKDGTAPGKTDHKTTTDKKTDKDGSDKKISDRVSVISLILPFGLDHLNSGATYTPAGLKKASLALDFYRGFKLALDSLTEQGTNYKLQVFDSKDEAAQSRSLAFNTKVKSSDLIVGPVFPEGIKMFSSVPGGPKAFIISPLSPASPATYSSPNIITVIPPLEYHAAKAAAYISGHIKTKKVFILKSGYSDELGYISFFKKALDTLKKNVQVVQLTVSKGNLRSIIPQLSKTDRNFFVIPSTKENFLKVTLYSLDTLANKYPVMVFGHPNWEKYSYLKPKQLQRINTHITSADRVNYRAASTATFVRNYRRLYGADPSEYAIKAFDEGLYFGQLLAENELKELNEKEFSGLHNNFSFVKKAGQGWVNTYVRVLKYTNFELKQVE